MKKSMLVILVVMLLTLLSLSGNAQAGTGDVRTLVLSNELGPEGQGGLIDRLISAGHGSDNLYQILQLLAAQPGSGIPADFVTEVGNNLPGSDVFTAAFSNFAGLNGPVCINADGTMTINPIFGRDYDGHTGYVTSNATIAGVARVSYTLASNSSYFIDAGDSSSVPGQRYLAIGIAWEKSTRSFVLSNEAPGYLIDKLIAAGHWSENLYQVLQFLAAQPGSGIPADFVTEVGNNLPGSEVFTDALSNFGSINNNPICINADGRLTINAIYGLDYYDHVGYVTNNVQYACIGPAKVTMATSPINYIDAGSSSTVGSSGTNYRAIGIAWAGDVCAKPVKTSAPVAEYDYIQTAYNTPASPKTILAQGTELVEALIFADNKITTLTGGYDCYFATNCGFTTINSLTIGGTDTVTISQLIIK